MIELASLINKTAKKNQENMDKMYKVLPYRAGYESVDRNAIQRALARGKLTGVVSTSGLELGIDIGEIDLIVLLKSASIHKNILAKNRSRRPKKTRDMSFHRQRGTLRTTLGGFENTLIPQLKQAGFI